jgi:hypothetical protein
MFSARILRCPSPTPQTGVSVTAASLTWLEGLHPKGRYVKNRSIDAIFAAAARRCFGVFTNVYSILDASFFSETRPVKVKACLD